MPRTRLAARAPHQGLRPPARSQHRREETRLADRPATETAQFSPRWAAPGAVAAPADGVRDSGRAVGLAVPW